MLRKRNICLKNCWVLKSLFNPLYEMQYAYLPLNVHAAIFLIR